jgi:hypothetical protein
MKGKTKIKRVLALVLTIAALAAGQSAWAASTFTLTSSTSAGITTFTITRSESTATETVYYRTVSLSAIEGQHFTAVSGSLTFTAGQTSKTVTVTEGNPDAEVYRYQTGSRRSYRFEVLDIDGTVITHRDQTVNTTTPFTYSGTNVNNAIPNNSFVFLNGDPANLIGIGNCIDVAYTPPTSQVESSGTYQGYVLIDDSYDYSQKAATVSTNTLISSTGATAACLKTMGYKIYATVCFTMKEKNDGYYYVQIVPGTANASYDGADSEGSVNAPAYSVYKACFELKEGSGVYSGEGKMFFPHRFDYANRAAGGLNGTGTSQTNAWTEFPLAESKLWQQKFKSGYRDNNTGSVVLDPDVASITTRFDCAGSDNDTWGFKDLYVRMGLVDATAPTALNNYKVSGGRHQKGNIIYVSVPFSELVTVEGTPTLTTTWGTLSYCAGSGSNVLTFSGVIASNASGTLSISALSGTVRDLAGNAFSGTVSKNFGISLDATYVWSLSDFNQLATNTYEIATKTDLYRLANIVNVSSNDCDGITFRQTQDIVCDASYTPIGYYSSKNDYAYFRGTYDGQGHTVSGITVTRTGDTSADKYIGLFGYVYHGTVQNVVLANSTFTGYNYVGGIAGEISWGTVRNCRVESSVTIRVGNSPAENFGGVVGYFHGSGALMTGCVSAATIENNGLTCNDCGGISGDVDNCTLKDCLYIGTSVTGTGYVGSIAGSTNSATISNNYYTAISLGGVGAYTGAADQDGARLARTITLGEGISLGGTKTTYDVSGITAYGSTAIGYGGKIYSGAGQTLTLSYTGAVPAGYTLEGFSVNGTAIDGNSFTMPASNVTVTANLVRLHIILDENETGNVLSTLCSTYQGKQVEVSFSRQFSAGKASTICLPFPMTSISGGKVYEFQDVTYNSSDGWVATMVDATPNMVTETVANTPYLFLPDADGNVTFSGTIDNVPASVTAGTTKSGDWTFHGTYSRLDYGKEPFSGTVFGFAATGGKANDGRTDVTAGQFIKAADGAFIQPFRAYLTYSGSNSALQAPSRRVQSDVMPDRITVRLTGKGGGTTAVGTIDTATGEVTIERWFNLNGQPVDGTPAAPGLYLNTEGRKVLISE